MKKAVKYISLILFILSLGYCLFWTGYAVYCAYNGIDSGWAMPAMSDHELEYGAEAFLSGIAIGILFTAEYCPFVPLYQIIYIISVITVKLIHKKKRSPESS